MAAPLRVGVLAYPGCFASEVFGVPDLLTVASHVATATHGGGPGRDVAVVSPRGRVTASGRAVLSAGPPGAVDVLVVPGFEVAPGVDVDATLRPLDPEREVIRSAAAGGAAVVGICLGAFVLADAGLLDGRRSTTSWLFADRLAQRCPATEVRPERLVVTDRGVTTTGGFSAMYDFALDLIGEHDGDDVARTTARITLVDDARTSQAPYVDPDLLPAAPGVLARRVRGRLDQRLAEPYDLAALAAAFHVSTRTLLRRFRAETGSSPLEYLQAARVRRARHLLESTDRAVAGIAGEVGYRDAGAFSDVFARIVGQRPGAYRAQFGRAALPRS